MTENRVVRHVLLELERAGLGFAVQSDWLGVLRRTHAAERADGPREWDGFGSRPSSSVVAPQRDRGSTIPVDSRPRRCPARRFADPAYRQQFVTVTYWPYLVGP